MVQISKITVYDIPICYFSTCISPPLCFMLLYIALCFRSAVVKLLLCLMTAPICAFCLIMTPLKFISRKQYRSIIGSFCQMAWIRATWFLIPTPILHISGDIPDATRPRIIIANHQVDVDFIYVWMALNAYEQGNTVKIIMKDELKYVPLFGWAVYLCDFIFLKRDWMSDKKGLMQKLCSFGEDGMPVGLVLFPEGTTVNIEERDAGNKFAKTRNRYEPKLLCAPRYKGFAACLEALSAGGHEVEVIDLTLAFSGYRGEVPRYSDGYSRQRDVEVPDGFKLCGGKGPRECHVHFAKCDVAKARANPEMFLDERWKKKDEQMAYFSEHQKFPRECTSTHLMKNSPNGSMLPMLSLCGVVLVAVAAIYIPLVLLH